MTVDIRASLHRAEEDLLTSIGGGNLDELEAFASSWSTLLDTLTSQPLDPETRALAYATAAREEVLTTSFIELHTHADAIISGVMSDLDGIFKELSLSDHADVASPPPRPATQNHTPSSGSTPPYIAPAYKWLLKNIHNPYPSKETKELISRGTGTSLQNIDAWFLNARRRIGWTSISKKYYSGSKADTIAAASRALSKAEYTLLTRADDQEPTPLAANIWMAFVEMEDVAKQLYSEKFTQSRLAGRLDGMVKDMTDDDKQRRREERKQKKAAEKQKEQHEKEGKRQREAQRRWKEAQEGYPSPSPEPESLKRRFETPSFVDSQDEEDLTPLLPIAGRKRPSTEDSSDQRQSVDERPAKRSRILSSSSSCSSVDTFYSASRLNSLEPFPLSPSSTACSTPPPSTPSEDTSSSLPQQDAPSKRKRRLSDADAEPRPKRPMALVRPRLQVVSDPLPKSVSSPSRSTSSPSTVDEPAVLDWSQFFDQHFMAVTDEVDTTGPIKMDMFDYSQFADYVSSGETSDGTDWEAQCEPFKTKGPLDPISQSSSPAIHVPSLTFTDFDLPAPVSVLPDFELDFCATMGWPYVDGIQSKSAPASSTLEDTELNKLDGLSSLVSLPPYQSGISSTSESPRSDEAAFDPLGSIDWSSIIPQTIPPTRPVVSTPLNPASIAPVTITPTAYLGGSVESRAEKLRKYQEHLAQARRLEAELAFV
uniref:Homeodomain 1 mating type protein n=1 Tax=Pleurotus tuoliensis TaxID=879823 RepID=G8D9Z7_9AGAR|nr:homeodomain 1 mating type protein [Pleurotus tuoliensis]